MATQMQVEVILAGNRIATCVLYTLGARDFSSAVSGFCQVFIVTRAKSLWSRALLL